MNWIDVRKVPMVEFPVLGTIAWIVWIDGKGRRHQPNALYELDASSWIQYEAGYKWCMLTSDLEALENGKDARGNPTEVEMKNVVAFCEIGKPEEWDGWKTRKEEEKDENG